MSDAEKKRLKEQEKEEAAAEKKKKQEAAAAEKQRLKEQDKEAKEADKLRKDGEKFLIAQEAEEQKRIAKEKEKALEGSAQALGQKRLAGEAGLENPTTKHARCDFGEGANTSTGAGQKSKVEAAPAGQPDAKRCKVEPAPAGQPDAKRIPQRPGPFASSLAWDGYYDDLKNYVLFILPSALKGFGMDLKGVPLHQLPPSRIEDNLVPTIGGIKMMTSRETWEPARAVMAMNTTGLYEGAGSLWWYAFPKDQVVYFLKHQLFRQDNKYAAVEAAKSHWGIEAYNATGEQQHMRHYVFPAIFPTACAGIQEVQHTIEGPKDEKGKIRMIPTFHGLPLLAGWPVVLAWLEAIWEAIQEGDGAKVIRLFEASFVNYVPQMVLWEQIQMPIWGRVRAPLGKIHCGSSLSGSYFKLRHTICIGASGPKQTQTHIPQIVSPPFCIQPFSYL